MAGRRRVTDWEEEAPKDLDPEAEPVDESENESGSGESEDENAGTEHYVAVGKSKLRQKEGVSLGPKYRGARVSRDALNDSSNDDSDVFEDAQEQFDSSGEEFDDPETADLSADEARAGGEDFEIESDDALGDSDDEKLGDFVFRGSSQPKDKKRGQRSKRPTAADFISGEEDEDDDNEEEDDEEDGAELDDEEDDEEDSEDGDEDLMDGLEDSDEEDEEMGSDDESAEDSEEDSDGSDAKPRRRSANKADARAEQRKLMSEGQKALAATISAAAQQDAQKGLAVREQRKTFDGLLNIRIRLQKAIVATNSFSAAEHTEDDAEQNSEPYEAAEEAALKLLNTLDSFRASLLPGELASQAAGAKRKRGDADASTPSETIWDGIQETEQRALKYRKKVLETWSGKTRSATVEVKNRNLVSAQQSIVASLEEQLLNADRLVKRTRTPRSCAPAQVARKVNEDPEVYDDADFYQLMLKELVEQRTSDSGGAAAQPTVRWAAMKEAKTKKHVDRRASKGRKMRFNIHEKLQNFMAPEDRRSWEQDAIDRLFGTLFGQKLELGEQASGDEMDDDEVDAEEEGLRLFRS